MRKIVFLISFLASGFVLADGFYAGGQLGADLTEIGRKHYLNFTNGPSDYHIVRKNASTTRMNGGLYGGYKIDLKNDMRVAIELDTFLMSEKIKTVLKFKTIAPGPDEDFKEKLELKESYGLSVLLGYALSDTTEVYGRLGVSYQNFRYSSLFDPNANVEVLETYLNKSQKLNPFGLVLGVGVETSLGKLNETLENVYVRADYRYIKYQRSSMRYIAADGLTAADISTAGYNLSKHMVMLGVDYRF